MIKEDKLKNYQWHDWFAWYPIDINEWVSISDTETIRQDKIHTHTITSSRNVLTSKYVWLEKIERKATSGFHLFGIHIYNWEYRLKK